MNLDEQTIIPCSDLDEAIKQYSEQHGYRLDMIAPADAPREALMSRDGASLRLIANSNSDVQGPNSPHDTDSRSESLNPVLDAEWITGRAGMDYRDLIPDRMGGQVIASHIRLTKGGDVSDYVHYHKVDFQMIRCIKGRIRVVYEDQGEPFWLEPGDWVIQPPEIRHRVLECESGSEVIEITMPSDHETWVEHEMTLPTSQLRPEREFSGQRFVRYIAPKT